VPQGEQKEKRRRRVRRKKEGGNDQTKNIKFKNRGESSSNEQSKKTYFLPSSREEDSIFRPQLFGELFKN